MAIALVAAETQFSIEEAADIVADLIAEVTTDSSQPAAQVPMLCEDPILASSKSAFHLARKTFSKNAEPFVTRLKAFLESSRPQGEESEVK